MVRRAAALALFALSVAQAQPVPRFEVASVKPYAGQGGPIAVNIAGPGAVSITNVPVLVLASIAFDLPVEEVLDMPRWATTERFDVRATPPEGATLVERRAMLRTLLADRFGLVAQQEIRPRDVYDLVVARPGRLGPNLTPSAHDCAAFLKAGGHPLDPGSPRSTINRQPLCAGAIGLGTVVRMTFGGVPMAEVVRRLRTYLTRPIVDKTGLTGHYDVVLQATSERFSPLGVAPTDAPSIFSAVEEQLGLRLERRQAPLDVLVVTSVERPAADQ